MARLLPFSEIDWREDGTPVQRGADDIYFSVEDGLAETRAVFLGGCGLPDAWAGRGRFVVGETGFGTGLNFLALWQMWKECRPSPDARLDFVSFEGFPLRREDAARALGAWPELSALADELLMVWPGPSQGVRRLEFADGVSLTLHLGDIRETFPDAQFAADAWFLDGFSPAKNEAMWGDWIYPELARCSAEGARVGTFTVAGAVRRGLNTAGFEAERVTGHGRKRQRLEARLAEVAAPAADVYGLNVSGAGGRVAVIGAGIAGAGAARALAAGGADVTVFDGADAVASGASGNAMALLMPRLDAGDTPTARFLIDAYLAARETYRGRTGITETEVRQTPRDEAEARRFEKVLADPPLPLENLEALQGGGLLHKGAMILRPAELVPDLLKGADVRLGRAVEVDISERTVSGERFDAVILASGMATGDLLPWLKLEGRLGQVEHLLGGRKTLAHAEARGTYALSVGGERLWGATFERLTGEPAVTEAARAENLAALQSISPCWVGEALGGEAVSRVGVRATTPDRLPLIGAVPDYDRMVCAFAELRNGRMPDVDMPLMQGVFIASGFGARGFTFAPWAGNFIMSLILGAPLPAPLAVAKAVHPSRLILRALKRREI